MWSLLQSTVTHHTCIGLTLKFLDPDVTTPGLDPRICDPRQAFLKLLALRKELRVVLTTIEQNPDAVEACLLPCEKVRRVICLNAICRAEAVFIPMYFVHHFFCASIFAPKIFRLMFQIFAWYSRFSRFSFRHSIASLVTFQYNHSLFLLSHTLPQLCLTFSFSQAGMSDPLIRDARAQLVFTRRWLEIKGGMLAAAAARSVDKMRTTLQESLGAFSSYLFFAVVFCMSCQCLVCHFLPCLYTFS